MNKLFVFFTTVLCSYHYSLLCTGFTGTRSLKSKRYGCAFVCKATNICIKQENVCDGQEHCSDGQDEKECDWCVGNTFHCEADRKCIPANWRCDYLFKDCPSGEDEAYCPCDFVCEADRECIKKEIVCNGYPSCSDGQDEKQCDSCQGDFSFHCPADRMCIPLHRRCDENVDCPSGEDELECSLSARSIDKRDVAN